MRAGPLRHQVAIYPLVETRSATGQRTQTWPTSVGTFQAEIRPLSSRELANAGQVKAAATHLVRLRYTIPLAPTTRLVFEGRTFSIIGVPRNIDERNREYLLDCQEIPKPT